MVTHPKVLKFRKRLPRAQADEVRAMLIKQHGAICVMDGLGPWETAPGVFETLCVDHKDNDRENNIVANYQLLHKGCNRAKDNFRKWDRPIPPVPEWRIHVMARRQMQRAVVDAKEAQRAESEKRPSLFASTTEVRRDEREREKQLHEETVRMGYHEGSPEMQKSQDIRFKFRKWILAKIEKHGEYGHQAALDGGAEHCGCDQQAIRRKLGAMASDEGPLLRITNDSGRIVYRAKSLEKQGLKEQ